MTIKVIKTHVRVKGGNMLFKKKKKADVQIDREWKEKNKEYIRELERFLDRSDAIKDESTRLAIVAQMLKCDEVLTKICEEKLLESYNEGYKKGENAHNTL